MISRQDCGPRGDPRCCPAAVECVAESFVRFKAEVRSAWIYRQRLSPRFILTSWLPHSSTEWVMRGAWSGWARKERENTNKRTEKNGKKEWMCGKMNAAKKNEVKFLREIIIYFIYSSVLWQYLFYTQTPMYIDPMTLPLVVATHLKVERSLFKNNRVSPRARLSLSLADGASWFGQIFKPLWDGCMDVRYHRCGSDLGHRVVSPLPSEPVHYRVDIQAVLVAPSLWACSKPVLSEFSTGSHLFKKRSWQWHVNRKSSDKPDWPRWPFFIDSLIRYDWR